MGRSLQIITKRERRARVYKIFNIYFVNQVTFLLYYRNGILIFLFITKER